LNDYIGEFAALGTSICFAFGSTLFTLSGREIGSPLVNRARLLMALTFIVIIHWLALGSLAPIHAELSHWFWLGLSGLIGFVLGDALLFQAFVMIGPRLSMLMMALSPVFSVILAWVFLGEQLSLQELSGIALAVGGVIWVVAGDRLSIPDKPGRYYFIGILFGLGGALGQAGGLVTAKLGLEDDFSALSGIFIRLLVATIIIWSFTTFRGLTVSSFKTLAAHPRAVRFMTGAVIMGPVLGVWLSLIAVQKAPVGIASTLSSLTPIFLLPVGFFIFRETIGFRAIVGTLIAVVGTILLFV
jgi:drug/metabolite transporter (DMT)-like permease